MQFRTRLALVGLAVVAAAGGAYAVVSYPQPLGMPVTIGTPAPQPPVANYSGWLLVQPTPQAQGGFGDVIHYVRLGRDQVGPFCSLIVEQGASSPNPAVANLQGSWANFYGQQPPSPKYPAMTPPWVMAMMPVGTNPLAMFELVYRPTNDPSDPSWGANPAPAGVFNDAMKMCKQFADLMNDFRVRGAAANSATNAPPSMNVWVNVAPGTAGYGEFFMYDLRF